MHLFGATFPPGCANFAVQRTAQDHEEELGSYAANVLCRYFYVDNGLKLCTNTEETTNLIKSVKEMCSRGGFILHKFVIKGIQDINLDLDKLHWCIQSDSFQFRLVLQDRPCTCRGILSTISSVFYPLEFITPVILEAKSILLLQS